MWTGLERAGLPSLELKSFLILPATAKGQQSPVFPSRCLRVYSQWAGPAGIWTPISIPLQLRKQVPIWMLAEELEAVALSLVVREYCITGSGWNSC